MRDTQTLAIYQARHAVLQSLKRFLEAGSEVRETVERGPLERAWRDYQGLLDRAMGVDTGSRDASLDGMRKRKARTVV